MSRIDEAFGRQFVGGFMVGANNARGRAGGGEGPARPRGGRAGRQPVARAVSARSARSRTSSRRTSRGESPILDELRRLVDQAGDSSGAPMRKRLRPPDDLRPITGRRHPRAAGAPIRRAERRARPSAVRQSGLAVRRLERAGHDDLRRRGARARAAAGDGAGRRRLRVRGRAARRRAGGTARHAGRLPRRGGVRAGGPRAGVATRPSPSPASPPGRRR